jgi:hypothetical protein
MTGGMVCRVHGGSAPQVIAAARRRLLMAADPAAARLVQIALNEATEPKDAIVAIRELLNRAGVTSQPPDDAATGSNDGTVLWEEFVALHRMRVGNTETPVE